MSLLFTAANILGDPVVRAALAEAWAESKPGLVGGHEEGGFITLGKDDKLNVCRWPKGRGDLIEVPAHAGCMADGLPVVATFHTHPNTGPDYMQEPGETDKRGVRDDADLKGPLYAGEFVIADEMIYMIAPSGMVRQLDRRTKLLG